MAKQGVMRGSSGHKRSKESGGRPPTPMRPFRSPFRPVFHGREDAAAHSGSAVPDSGS